jgi:hypothetical protein
MKNRNSILLILALVFVGYFAINGLDLYRSDKGQLLKLKSKYINSMYINNAGVTLNLEKKDGIWVADNFRLKSAEVDLLLGSYFGTADLISTNPSKNEKYQVGVSQNKWIIFNNKSKVLIGKNAQNTIGTYVRESSAENIYKVKERAYKMLPNKNRLLERKAFDIDFKTLKLVKVQAPSMDISVKLKDERWQFSDVNDVSANVLVARINKLNLFGNLTQTAVTISKDQKAELKLTLLDDKTKHKIDLFKRDDNPANYYLKDIAGYWFEISKSNVDGVVSGLEVKPKEPSE